MPIATIPGLASRACVVEVFEPAQTQDDAEVVLDHFELGPNEVRENYQVPTPYTSYRYVEEPLDTITERKEGRNAKSEPAKLLPHMQAEGEAGQKRLGEVGPAIEAVDDYQREQGIELPAERAQRWQDDVESLKGGNVSIEESSRKVLEGRVNRTQQDMVPVGEDDYESSGGTSGAKQAKGRSGAGKTAKEDKAAEARQKAQERREQQNR